VPPGKFDWKSHEKSMIFGYLANARFQWIMGRSEDRPYGRR